MKLNIIFLFGLIALAFLGGSVESQCQCVRVQPNSGGLLGGLIGLVTGVLGLILDPNTHEDPLGYNGYLNGVVRGRGNGYITVEMRNAIAYPDPPNLPLWTVPTSGICPPNNYLVGDEFYGFGMFDYSNLEFRTVPCGNDHPTLRFDAVGCSNCVFDRAQYDVPNSVHFIAKVLNTGITPLESFTVEIEEFFSEYFLTIKRVVVVEYDPTVCRGPMVRPGQHVMVHGVSNAEGDLVTVSNACGIMFYNPDSSAHRMRWWDIRNQLTRCSRCDAWSGYGTGGTRIIGEILNFVRVGNDDRLTIRVTGDCRAEIEGEDIRQVFIRNDNCNFGNYQIGDIIQLDVSRVDDLWVSASCGLVRNPTSLVCDACLGCGSLTDRLKGNAAFEGIIVSFTNGLLSVMVTQSTDPSLLPGTIRVIEVPMDRCFLNRLAYFASLVGSTIPHVFIFNRFNSAVITECGFLENGTYDWDDVVEICNLCAVPPNVDDLRYVYGVVQKIGCNCNPKYVSLSVIVSESCANDDTIYSHEIQLLLPKFGCNSDVIIEGQFYTFGVDISSNGNIIGTVDFGYQLCTLCDDCPAVPPDPADLIQLGFESYVPLLPGPYAACGAQNDLPVVFDRCVSEELLTAYESTPLHLIVNARLVNGQYLVEFCNNPDLMYNIFLTLALYNIAWNNLGCTLPPPLCDGYRPQTASEMESAFLFEVLAGPPTLTLTQLNPATCAYEPSNQEFDSCNMAIIESYTPVQRFIYSTVPGTFVHPINQTEAVAIVDRCFACNACNTGNLVSGQILSISPTEIVVRGCGANVVFNRNFICDDDFPFPLPAEGELVAWYEVNGAFCGVGTYEACTIDCAALPGTGSFLVIPALGIAIDLLNPSVPHFTLLGLDILNIITIPSIVDIRVDANGLPNFNCIEADIDACIEVDISEVTGIPPILPLPVMEFRGTVVALDSNLVQIDISAPLLPIPVAINIPFLPLTNLLPFLTVGAEVSVTISSTGVTVCIDAGVHVDCPASLGTLLGLDLVPPVIDDAWNLIGNLTGTLTGIVNIPLIGPALGILLTPLTNILASLQLLPEGFLFLPTLDNGFLWDLGNFLPEEFILINEVNGCANIITPSILNTINAILALDISQGIAIVPELIDLTTGILDLAGIIPGLTTCLDLLLPVTSCDFSPIIDTCPVPDPSDPTGLLGLNVDVNLNILDLCLDLDLGVGLLDSLFSLNIPNILNSPLNVLDGALGGLLGLDILNVGLINGQIYLGCAPDEAACQSFCDSTCPFTIPPGSDYEIITVRASLTSLLQLDLSNALQVGIDPRPLLSLEILENLSGINIGANIDVKWLFLCDNLLDFNLLPSLALDLTLLVQLDGGVAVDFLLLPSSCATSSNGCPQCPSSDLSELRVGTYESLVDSVPSIEDFESIFIPGEVYTVLDPVVTECDIVRGFCGCAPHVPITTFDDLLPDGNWVRGRILSITATQIVIESTWKCIDQYVETININPCDSNVLILGVEYYFNVVTVGVDVNLLLGEYFFVTSTSQVIESRCQFCNIADPPVACVQIEATFSNNGVYRYEGGEIFTFDDCAGIIVPETPLTSSLECLPSITLSDLCAYNQVCGCAGPIYEFIVQIDSVTGAQSIATIVNVVEGNGAVIPNTIVLETALLTPDLYYRVRLVKRGAVFSVCSSIITEDPIDITCDGCVGGVSPPPFGVIGRISSSFNGPDCLILEIENPIECGTSTTQILVPRFVCGLHQYLEDFTTLFFFEVREVAGGFELTRICALSPEGTPETDNLIEECEMCLNCPELVEEINGGHVIVRGDFEIVDGVIYINVEESCSPYPIGRTRQIIVNGTIPDCLDIPEQGTGLFVLERIVVNGVVTYELRKCGYRPDEVLPEECDCNACRIPFNFDDNLFIGKIIDLTRVRRGNEFVLVATIKIKDSCEVSPDALQREIQLDIPEGLCNRDNLLEGVLYMFSVRIVNGVLVLNPCGIREVDEDLFDACENCRDCVDTTPGRDIIRFHGIITRIVPLADYNLLVVDIDAECEEGGIIPRTIRIRSPRDQCSNYDLHLNTPFIFRVVYNETEDAYYLINCGIVEGTWEEEEELCFSSCPCVPQDYADLIANPIREGMDFISGTVSSPIITREDGRLQFTVTIERDCFMNNGLSETLEIVLEESACDQSSIVTGGVYYFYGARVGDILFVDGCGVIPPSEVTPEQCDPCVECIDVPLVDRIEAATIVAQGVIRQVLENGLVRVEFARVYGSTPAEWNGNPDLQIFFLPGCTRDNVQLNIPYIMFLRKDPDEDYVYYIDECGLYRGRTWDEILPIVRRIHCPIVIEKPDHYCVCSRIPRPVCGSVGNDDVTLYHNECVMRCTNPAAQVRCRTSQCERCVNSCNV